MISSLQSACTTCRTLNKCFKKVEKLSRIYMYNYYKKMLMRC